MMIRNDVRVQGKQAFVFVVPREQMNVAQIEREAIIEVLERAAGDDYFIAQLTYSGEEALRGYALGSEAEAALLSGDIRWLETRLGELDDRLSTWPSLRLQQEIW